MAEHAHVGMDEPTEDEIERRETVLRIGLTLLFMVVVSVLEVVVGVVVTFELLIALVTRRPPSPRVRDFANRVISYYYRIGRYITYNESRVPFPFSDFPAAVEPEAYEPGERESDSVGWPARDPWDDDPEAR